VADDRPVWRQGFDAVEGAIGPRLNTVVNSEAFGVAVGLMARFDRAMRQRAEQTTRRLLHAWNLPTGSDVTRMLKEIGRLQQQVNELSRQVTTTRGEQSNGAQQHSERSARTGTT
jgi:hypothetical protein